MDKFRYLLDMVRKEDINIYTDSRKVTPNSVFVAIRGNVDAGIKYVPQAIELGANYIVCESEYEEDVLIYAKESDKKIYVVCHDNICEAIWLLARSRYKTDEMDILKIGITGTNGKTTTAYILEHIFLALGYKVGVIGTVSYRWAGHCENASLTTPDSITLHRILAEMNEAEVKVIIMEVSSHAISQERAGGVDFDGAIFTNLTQDHLDYHVTMDEYFNAKSKLFTILPKKDKSSVINADDFWGKSLIKISSNVYAYGFENIEADNYLKGNIVESNTKGLQLEMHYNDVKWQLNSPLVGKFNAYNLLAAQALCLSMGIRYHNLLALETFKGVCGRLERIENHKNLDIFVDYAHTPDALENVLNSLRVVGFTKIITVFGCGGNRDKSKRPLMGKAVSLWSDIAIITSDNPRNEKAEDIIADILPGMSNNIEVIVEQDRRLALKIALDAMQPGYALLVAGKGHECYQQIGDVNYPFSDQKIIKELLECI